MFKQNVSFEVWGGAAGKYRLRDNNGDPLENTPEDTCNRVATALSNIETSKQEYWLEQFKSILGHKFAGGGRIMANIGAGAYKKETSPINCTVLRQIPDSMNGIMDIAKEAALLLKSGCGVGYDFSSIRPKGSHVFGAGAATSGVISFMKIYDAICSTIMSGGGRRGAQMACLDISSPEIEDFIVEKRKDGSLRYFNCSILITDDFMNAVVDDLDWDLWFWEKMPDTEVPTSEVCLIKKCDIPYNHSEFNYFSFDADHTEVVYENCTTTTLYKKKVFKTVKAKYLFDLVMTSTYNFWEPGFVLIDKSNRENTLYFCEIFRATNPCFSGDTLIAVADGRNAVSIKELAEADKDVPVYSVDKITGEVSIKMGRHPRITGSNEKLVRVMLDDGTYLDTTPNHKFVLLDGSEIEAKNLKNGDSLPRFTKSLEAVKKGSKDYYAIHSNTNDTSKKIFEHRLIAKFNNKDEWNSKYSEIKGNGFIKTGGLVVHHKDYNQLNNSPDNLQIMTFKDHCVLHGQIDQCGEKNGRYSGVSSSEIKRHALILTRLLNRRFSDEEWRVYAKNNKLPQQFSKFRVNDLGTLRQLAILCALELKIDNSEFVNLDPRVVRSYQSMIEQGYNAQIVDGEVFVDKACETCKKTFNINFSYREQSFCSSMCSSLYFRQDPVKIERQRIAIDKYNSEKMEKIRNKQIKVYSDLKFALNRAPLFKEFAIACKQLSLPHRVGKVLKFGFKSFSALKKAAELYNHKVVSIIELDGEHTVYNITVDDNHTVGIITGSKEKNGSLSYSGVYVAQCGEQPLAGQSSCLLGSMVLPAYAKNAFENAASFDFDTFAKDVRIASRLLDNVVEVNNLPLEQMRIEIKNKRRHGMGFTGLGSLLNMLGMPYGSEDSLILLDKISYILAKESLLENISLAKEKGCAPIFTTKEARQLVIKSAYLERLIDTFDNKEDIIKDILEYGLRYSHATSIAPTGTLSLTWGNNCSNGIEPVFANSYLRNIRDPNKKTKVQEEVFDYAYFLWKEKFGNKKLPAYWRTTDNLDVMDHLKIQATAQKWCDSAISKTINVPSDYPFDKFKDVYLNGWKMGLKGITTYRPNAEIGSGVLTQKHDLENTEYTFTLEDGSEVSLKGSDFVEYDGETHNVANLFDALKEGIYGNM